MALTVEQEKQVKALQACIFVSVARHMGVFPTAISESFKVECTFEDEDLLKAATYLAAAGGASWMKENGYPTMGPEWSHDRVKRESIEAFADLMANSTFPTEKFQEIVKLDLASSAQEMVNELLSKGSLNADDLRRLSK